MKLTLVIPIYGYSRLIAELDARIRDSLSSKVEDLRVIFVEDFGTEESWNRISEFANRQERVAAIRLAENCGQHMAIKAGISSCTEGWVAVMDGDLQDPPELLPHLWTVAQKGTPLVMTVRKETGQSQSRNFASMLFSSLLFGRWNPPRFACFSLLSRDVAESFLSHPLSGHFFTLTLSRLKAPRTIIDYNREATETSTYNVGSLIQLAVRKLLLRYIPHFRQSAKQPVIMERIGF